MKNSECKSMDVKKNLERSWFRGEIMNLIYGDLVIYLEYS